MQHSSHWLCTYQCFKRSKCLHLQCQAYRRPHKHYREHVASCEGFSESLKQEGGLHTSPSSLHVRGEVQGRESGPIHKVPSPPRHIRLERMSNPFRIVVCLPPAFTASPITGKSSSAQLAVLRIFTF